MHLLCLFAFTVTSHLIPVYSFSACVRLSLKRTTRSLLLCPEVLSGPEVHRLFTFSNASLQTVKFLSALGTVSFTGLRSVVAKREKDAGGRRKEGVRRGVRRERREMEYKGQMRHIRKMRQKREMSEASETQDDRDEGDE